MENGLKIRRVSSKTGSETYELFLDCYNNPNKYEGQIIYLYETGSIIYEPFNITKKFYFNNQGVWILWYPAYKE